jgi:hypothetical protein
MKLKLYHGTTTTYLKKILRGGLKPRGDGESQWAKYPSRSDMVYLTVAYPFYFALNAARGSGKPVVFEIDANCLDQDRFYPDEDCVCQVLKTENSKVRPAQVRRDLEKYQGHWMGSLRALGNCCYKGKIPRTAITRYCMVDQEQCPDLMALADSPAITVDNYLCMGKQHTGLVEWMFGDRRLLPGAKQPNIVLPQWFDPRNPPKSRRRQEWEMLRNGFERAKEANAFWRKQSKDRTGIQVVTVGDD